MPGCCKRAYRRSWFESPGRTESRAHTSLSGPYWAVFRQPLQVVAIEQASQVEGT